MKDTAKGASASSQASEPDSAIAARSTREPVPRRIYLTMRLAELGVDVIEMARERERLTSELKAPSSIDGPNHKQLRLRRAYVAERIDIMRKEQADLNAEKKAMGPAGGPGPVAEKINKIPDGRKTIIN